MLDIPVTVACYCGDCAYPITLTVKTNPTACDLCHCDSCRHCSGGLFIAAIRSDPPPAELLSSGALTGYSTSPGVTRCFCTRCGSHMQAGHKWEGGEWWNVMVGVIKDHGDLKVEIGAHEFVGDTKDGGGAEFWEKGTRWVGEAGESVELPIGWQSDELKALDQKAPPADRLLAQCHCGGISFLITRPTPKSNESPVRYDACICACDSCQRAHGFWGTAWCFVQKDDLLTADGKPIDFDNLGTLKEVNKGEIPDAYHGFCGRCGATVLFWKDSRGSLIDIGVGLLRAPDGARAESWLDWRLQGPTCQALGRPENVFAALKDGMQAFGKRKEVLKEMLES